MAGPRFGTDGIRGVANLELTAELALAVGRAVARVMPSHQFVVGRDTRRSGSMLQAALSAGMATEGADVLDGGVLPTPGVAFLAEQRHVPAAVVSASHNPFADNGIKLFGVGGTKLSLEVEEAIERELDAVTLDPDRPPLRPSGPGVGLIMSDAVIAGEYRHHLRQVIGGRRLQGLRVVLDCANGASSVVGPEVFAALGATVHTLHCDPDGVNINLECGSTHPGGLVAAVTEHGAHLGLALDGDADRAVAVDHRGELVDGDQLLGLFAADLDERAELPGRSIVVTVMSNMGLRLAMEERGITVVETPVGDRNVLEVLEAEGFTLGGEQSGHVIFRDKATTGDGILTGVMLADLLVRSGRPLAELLDGLVERLPQVLLNVPVAEADLLEGCREVWDAVADVEEKLAGSGRVLVRASGTEPVVRVMVEARTPSDAETAADHLSTVVRDTLGVGAGPLDGSGG